MAQKKFMYSFKLGGKYKPATADQMKAVANVAGKVIPDLRKQAQQKEEGAVLTRALKLY